jgi:hypothetical protein
MQESDRARRLWAPSDPGAPAARPWRGGVGFTEVAARGLHQPSQRGPATKSGAPNERFVFVGV